MKMNISHSLVALCLIISLVPLFGQGIDLNKRVELQLNKVNVKEAVETVEKKAGVSFAFNNQLLKGDRRYSWSFKNKSLRQVLDTILKPEGLSYQVSGNRILLFRSKGKQTSTSGQKEAPIDPTFTGWVIDQQTNEPIYFAHLVIEGTSIGTVANEEGRFRIKIPASVKDKRLSVSSIGYEEVAIPIGDLYEGIKIALPIASIDFAAITISEEKVEVDPLAIVQDAIAKIPDNYPDAPVKLSTYYRELIKTNDIYTKFSDAAADIYYTGYQNHSFNQLDVARKYNDYSGFAGSSSFPFSRNPFDFYPNPSDQVQIIEARSSDNLQRYDELAFLENEKEIEITQRMLARDIGGGPLRMMAYDHIKNLTHLFSPANLKHYQFEFQEVTKDGGDYVYRINFAPKRKNLKKSRFQGELIIDYKTKAFRKINYSIPAFAQKKAKRRGLKIITIPDRKFRKSYDIDLKRLKVHSYVDDLNIQVSYFPYKGKWYLKQISEAFTYKNDFLKVGTSTYETRCDLVVNDIQLEKVDSIAKKDQYRTITSNFLFEYPLSYDPDFWKSYPALITDKVTEEAIKDLEQTHTLEEQFASKFKYDSTLQAPIAQKLPFTTKVHGDKMVDDYHWLRNKYDDNTLAYLEAENKYTRNYFLPHKARQRAMYYEMVDKIEKRYETLPTKNGPYFYTYQYENGLPHEIYYRRKGSMDEPAEVILDVNKLAASNLYFSIDGITISPDNQLLAYFENTSGGLENVVRFKNLNNDQLLADSLLNVSSLVWSKDNQTLYYTQTDTTKRDYQVYRYVLKSNQAPELLFEEKDTRFDVGVYKTKSKDYIIINSESKEENEQYWIQDGVGAQAPRLLQKRQPGQMVMLSHYQDEFYILSNHDNPDFALYKTTGIQNTNKNAWQTVVNHTSDTILTDYERVGNFLVLEESVQMQPHLKIINLVTKQDTLIKPDAKELASLWAASIHAEEEEYIYIFHSSPISPAKTYKYHLATGKQTLVKERKVLGGYQEENYTTQRICAKSMDGIQIPITILYKKEGPALAERPLHLMGYGAYGIQNTAGLSVAHLPFLDQGGILAYPHIRGGSELGDQWYQAGKLLNKHNTFNDFITSVEYLLQQGYGDPTQVYASGGSAGGLLMGAVINKRPDLFKAVVLEVPFVDALNTMLDSTLTLTTLEYQEWGNPMDQKYYHYIKSYSPYDNVKAQDYPHLLFMTGYNDDLVGYWEAAKMVAKLRATKTDDKVLLLQTKMNGGHNGGSGRYEHYKNTSLIYTFFSSLK